MASRETFQYVCYSRDMASRDRPVCVYSPACSVLRCCVCERPRACRTCRRSGKTSTYKTNYPGLVLALWLPPFRSCTGSVSHEERGEYWHVAIFILYTPQPYCNCPLRRAQLELGFSGQATGAAPGAGTMQGQPCLPLQRLPIHLSVCGSARAREGASTGHTGPHGTSQGALLGKPCLPPQRELSYSGAPLDPRSAAWRAVPAAAARA